MFFLISEKAKTTKLKKNRFQEVTLRLRLISSSTILYNIFTIIEKRKFNNAPRLLDRDKKRLKFAENKVKWIKIQRLDICNPKMTNLKQVVTYNFFQYKKKLSVNVVNFINHYSNSR